MNTTNELIKYINTDTTIYKDIIKNIAKERWYNELWSDIMLILMEYNEEKLLEIWNKKYFKYFFIRIATNQFKSTSSNFDKTYRNDRRKEITTINLDFFNDEEITDEEDVVDIKIIMINQVKEFIKTLHWYDAKLFEMYYYKKMTYSQIAKETRIPKISIWDNVTTTMSDLKQYLNK